MWNAVLDSPRKLTICLAFQQPKGGKAKDAKRAEAKAKKEAKAGGGVFTPGGKK